MYTRYSVFWGDNNSVCVCITIRVLSDHKRHADQMWGALVSPQMILASPQPQNKGQKLQSTASKSTAASIRFCLPGLSFRMHDYIPKLTTLSKLIEIMY